MNLAMADVSYKAAMMELVSYLLLSPIVSLVWLSLHKGVGAFTHMLRHRFFCKSELIPSQLLYRSVYCHIACMM